jgi:hypothetical protein
MSHSNSHYPKESPLTASPTESPFLLPYPMELLDNRPTCTTLLVNHMLVSGVTMNLRAQPHKRKAAALLTGFYGGVLHRSVAPLRLLSISRYNHGRGRQRPLPFLRDRRATTFKDRWERTPLVGRATGRIAVHFFYE